MKRNLLLIISVLSFNSAFTQVISDGLLFDGTEDLVTIPIADAPVFNLGTGDFTLEAWIRDDAPTGIPSTECILSHYPSADGGLSFIIYDGHIALFANGIGCLGTNDDVRDGNCHHVAVVRSSSGIQYYLDGNPVGGGCINNNSVSSPVQNLLIGSFGNCGNFPGYISQFKGVLKEIRMWDVARTTSQIQDNMEVDLIGTQNPSLIGYWRLNEVVNGTVQDHSVTGATGYIGDDIACNPPCTECSPSLVTNCCGISCSSPENLFVSNVTTTSAKLNWAIEECAVGYKIQYRESGTSAWTTKNQNQNIGKKKITELSQGTTYQWRVKTKCSVNPVQFSSFTSIQTFSTSFRLSHSETSEPVVVISPNPFSQSTSVTLNQTGDFYFLICDIFGREVRRYQVSGLKFELERDNLPAGIYFYVVLNNNRQIDSGKVIIE